MTKRINAYDKTFKYILSDGGKPDCGGAYGVVHLRIFFNYR